MHNNIVQQFSYGIWSPPYRSQPSYKKTPEDSYSVNEKGCESPEKKNVPGHTLNTPSKGYGCTPVQPRRTNPPLEDGNVRPPSVEDFTSFMPYSQHSYVTQSQRIVSDNGNFNNTESSKDSSVTDSQGDSHGHLRTSDMPDFSDSSPSTKTSTTPQSNGSTTSSPDSAKSSPSSIGEPVSSPESETKHKKKARTNYTKEQIETLMKIFHDNPYPDSEMMERIALDLGVPENKIKIWFQNKRARWRRRVNNAPAFPQQCMPMPPALSPVSPYSLMSHGQMVTSSPTPFMLPGYYNYATMQSPITYPTTNNACSRLQLPHPAVTSTSHRSFPVLPSHQSMTSSLPYSTGMSPHLSGRMSSLPFSNRTSPPLSVMTSSLPYSSRNTSPVSQTASPSDSYLQYSQYTCSS